VGGEGDALGHWKAGVLGEEPTKGEGELRECWGGVTTHAHPRPAQRHPEPPTLFIHISMFLKSSRVRSSLRTRMEALAAESSSAV
jgi:hypothetical protein